MAWSSVGTPILLKTDWQYTEPVVGSYFKFKHSSFPVNNSYLIAQAQFNADNSVDISDIQELKAGNETEILCLKAPPVFTTRRIAVKKTISPSFTSELRRIIRADLLEETDIEFTARRSAWSIQIESSDYVEPVASTGGGTTPPPASTGKILTYASNGDTNGCAYWIGTNYGSETWSNPCTAGRLGITASSPPPAEGLHALVDRQPTDFYISGAANFNNFLTFDVGANYKLILNYYSIRGWSSPNNSTSLRNWKIRGSNNNSTWVDLDTQVNNTTLNTANQWLSIPVSGISVEYRYIQLYMTGSDSNNNNNLTIGEFELYGTLTTTT